MEYDLAVIGSGGAAFAAAIPARRRDLRVLLTERGRIGDTCVNTGCVPSKALLAAAHQPFPGIDTHADPVDLPALLAGKATLVAGMRAGKYVDLAADYGIAILRGQARFVPGPALAVERADGAPDHVEAGHYLIATGSTPGHHRSTGWPRPTT
jgi:mercuric reductase